MEELCKGLRPLALRLADAKIEQSRNLRFARKKNTLMQEYSSTKSTMDELYKIRKNYGIYIGKEMER
jgi:relaxase/mobilization nuclease domain protein